MCCILGGLALYTATILMRVNAGWTPIHKHPLPAVKWNDDGKPESKYTYYYYMNMDAVGRVYMNLDGIAYGRICSALLNKTTKNSDDYDLTANKTVLHTSYFDPVLNLAVFKNGCILRTQPNIVKYFDVWLVNLTNVAEITDADSGSAVKFVREVIVP